MQTFLYRLATGILYLRLLSEFAKLYHEEYEDILDYPVSVPGDVSARQHELAADLSGSGSFSIHHDS